jgi:hypothetical protein
MSIYRDTLEALGLLNIPWIIRIYLILFMTLLLVLVFAGCVPNGDIGSKLVSFADESIRLVLGAVIGALSMAAKSEWGDRDSHRTGASSGKTK